MQKKIFSLVFIFSVSLFVLSGCSENPVQDNEVQYDLVYERSGLIDSLFGDCNGTIVRTHFLDQFDFSNANSIKFTFDSRTDADMSRFEVFYTENGVNNFLVSLNADHMNNINSIVINNPGFNAELKTRITLNSSVCTGQIFYARVKNVRIYVN